MSEIDPPMDTALVNWSDLGVSGLLPTGTVTLLLADVEGSTRLWQTQPEEMTAAVARLDRVVCDDLGTIWACALAERAGSGSELQAGLLGEIRDEVLTQLRELYAVVARPNYDRLAARFNAAADKFMRGADIVDPAAPADQVIGTTNPKLLAAWRDSETFAETLEGLLEPLCCAAELARPLDAPSGLGGDRAPFLISLCCDPGEVHRRVVWSAWHDSAPPKPVGPALTLESFAPPPPHRPTRGGRWTRLWAKALGRGIRGEQSAARPLTSFRGRAVGNPEQRACDSRSHRRRLRRFHRLRPPLHLATWVS